MDCIINAGWVIPILPLGKILEGYSVAVTDGKISHIIPKQKKIDLISKRVFDLPNHVLLPGLINCHGHAAMTLLRGLADDIALNPWLQNIIWPIEKKYVSEAFVRDGTELAIAEMLLSGTTTFSDMYFFPETVANVAIASGMRCQISFPILDFPSTWAASTDEYISKGLKIRDRFKHVDLISSVFGPHSTNNLKESSLETISTLASELDLGIQIHLHETNQEVLQGLSEKGERPIETLLRLGLLGPKTQCVHMTELNTQDIQILSNTGAQVIHCPESNMKLASGISPITKLLQAGINVGIGTDGAASNNDLNLFGELQSAALLAKINTMDATSLTAPEALTLGTLGGAKALGLDQNIGTIEIGKFGDLIAIDLNRIEMQPIHNIFSQLIYVNNGSQVTHSWIQGEQIMHDRELLNIDQDDLRERTLKWQTKISVSELQ